MGRARTFGLTFRGKGVDGGDGSHPSSASGSSASSAAPRRRFSYARRRPELSTLHQVVRENLETLYAAVEAGFASAPLPDFVRRELEGFLDCGLLCRGFALLECEDCPERRLVAFSCHGRAFCPSCLGRRMEQTTANLLDHVVSRVPLRQFVLNLPFELRTRLAYDGALLGAVSRVFVDSVLGFRSVRRGPGTGFQAAPPGRATTTCQGRRWRRHRPARCGRAMATTAVDDRAGAAHPAATHSSATTTQSPGPHPLALADSAVATSSCGSPPHSSTSANGRKPTHRCRWRPWAQLLARTFRATVPAGGG